MDDVRTYQIEVQGQVEENNLNAKSPMHITIQRIDLKATLISLKTDQSGLIGLLRHLHGRGFVILSVLHKDP